MRVQHAKHGMQAARYPYVGYQQRRNRSRCRNQKRREICSIEKRSQKKNTDSAYALSLVIQWKLDCRSRKQKRKNQSQCSIPGLVIGWFFRLCFRLRQSSFHWTISDGVVNNVNAIGRNGNVLILPTPILPSLWLRLWLNRFSLGPKHSYDTDYDSVASENQAEGRTQDLGHSFFPYGPPAR